MKKQYFKFESDLNLNESLKSIIDIKLIDLCNLDILDETLKKKKLM